MPQPQPEQSTTFEIAPVSPSDLPAISALHARVIGPGRFARTAYRVREGTPPISDSCLLARNAGQLIAAVRMTPLAIGGTPGAMLLGPLAVDTAFSNKGVGASLMAAAADKARNNGHRLILLVGNLSYYGRHGYQAVNPGQITMPGPVDPARLLAFELQPDALLDYHGQAAAIR